MYLPSDKDRLMQKLNPLRGLTRRPLYISQHAAEPEDIAPAPETVPSYTPEIPPTYESQIPSFHQDTSYEMPCALEASALASMPKPQFMLEPPQENAPDAAFQPILDMSAQPTLEDLVRQEGAEIDALMQPDRPME